MAFMLSVLKETQPGERRVSMTPTTLPRLQSLGAEISIAQGCGEASTFPDERYSGCRIESDAETLVQGGRCRARGAAASGRPRPRHEAGRGPDLLHLWRGLARSRPRAPRRPDHRFRDGADPPHQPRAGDGRLVEPGGAGRLSRGPAGCRRDAAHPADDDDGGRLSPRREGARDGPRRRRAAGARLPPIASAPSPKATTSGRKRGNRRSPSARNSSIPASMRAARAAMRGS